MKKIIASTVVACAGMVAVAASETSPGPGIEGSPKPEVTLKDKNETITPGTVADGWAEGGKVDVQAKDNSLTVLMTGTAAAHCRVGCHSIGVQTFQLTQEFEITCDDPKVNLMVLSLEGALNGTLWARHKAGACMRLASAHVAPAGGSSPLGVSFPPLCISGVKCLTYHRKVGPIPGPPMPLGRYVLTACFTIDVGASGFVNGHGVADFSAEDPLPDNWKQEGNPFKEVDRKDFGFGVTLTAEPAGGPSTAEVMKIRPLIRQVSYQPRLGSSAKRP